MDDPSPIVDYESKDRRQRDVSRMAELSAAFQSPQTRGLILQALAIVGALALGWVVIAAILSVFKFWLVILLMIIIGTVVYAREWLANRRESWIQQGFCSQCGYNLRSEPIVCPECGRDAKLDEPAWRRMRRELEAKLLVSAQQDNTIATPAISPIPLDVPIAPNVRIVTKTPVTDDSPIPLEGEDPPAKER